MGSQLVLFESETLKIDVGGVWGRLSPAQRETATRLLVDLIARSVVDQDGGRCEAGEEQGSNDHG
jgi:phage head maturation protease